VQETEYPASEHIMLRVEPEKPGRFGVHLRIPAWLERQAEVFVNGKNVAVKAEPGTWATIRRQWKAGDRIEMTLPFAWRRAPIDAKTAELFALMKGPVMMTVVDPPEDLRVSEVPGNLNLRPFYEVQRETYTTYLRAKTV